MRHYFLSLEKIFDAITLTATVNSLTAVLGVTSKLGRVGERLFFVVVVRLFIFRNPRQVSPHQWRGGLAWAFPNFFRPQDCRACKIVTSWVIRRAAWSTKCLKGESAALKMRRLCCPDLKRGLQKLSANEHRKKGIFLIRSKLTKVLNSEN
jgi:hypothetical protein